MFIKQQATNKSPPCCFCGGPGQAAAEDAVAGNEQQFPNQAREAAKNRPRPIQH